MFIEKKSSGVYLAKKLFGKKILTKIGNKVIEENILNLNKKEFDFILLLESYKNFQKEIGLNKFTNSFNHI